MFIPYWTDTTIRNKVDFEAKKNFLKKKEKMNRIGTVKRKVRDPTFTLLLKRHLGAVFASHTQTP